MKKQKRIAMLKFERRVGEIPIKCVIGALSTLPPDAKLIGCHTNLMRNHDYLLIRCDLFDPVAEGHEIPAIGWIQDGDNFYLNEEVSK